MTLVETRARRTQLVNCTVVRQAPIAGPVLRTPGGCAPRVASAAGAPALPPSAKLFGRRSLLEQFDPGRAADRRVLAAFEEELACPWALYHVRRILPVSKADPTRRGRAMRSVERVHVGRAAALGRRLRTVSERHGYPVEIDEGYGRRAYSSRSVRRRD
jgi:hypothetical protein